MSFLRNRSIGGKLAILVAIPLALMIGITIYNSFAFIRISDRYKYSYDNFDDFAKDWCIAGGNLYAVEESIAKIILLEPDQTEQIRAHRENIVARRAENSAIYERFRTKPEKTTRELQAFSKIEELSPNLRNIQDRAI